MRGKTRRAQLAGEASLKPSVNEYDWLGAGIYFLRKAIPLKALDLAALLHVSAETISRWENGKTHLDLGAWATLARIFLEHLDGNSETRDRLRSIDDRKTKRVDLGRILVASEAE